MMYQTINEERGARRAAELRRRFRKVSNKSLGRKQFGVWPAGSQLRRTELNQFLLWCVLGVIVAFIGFVVF